MTRLVFTFAAFLAAAGAHADTGRPFASPAAMNSVAPPGIASLGHVTVALGLVLAAIFVAAWLLRRVRGLGKTATGALDVIADLPVGQKERAVLVRVGNTQILLGVAPGRVNTLHVLTEPVVTAPPADPNSPERPTFRSLLMKSLGKS
jgi:flagellar protein FliO/FliZ